MNDQTSKVSTGAVNPTPEQRIERNVGRIRTLRTKIAQMEAQAGTDRAASPEKLVSLRAELERRLGSVAELHASLQSVLDA